MRFILVLLVITVLSVQCSVTKKVPDLHLFGAKKNVVVLLEHASFRPQSDYLTKHLSRFLDKTIEVQETSKSDQMALVLRYQDTIIADQFTIHATENKLLFEAKSSAGMQQALNFFLIHILEYIPYSHRKSLLSYSSKSIPVNYQHSSKAPAFTYRVPYFIENYNDDFRAIHQTQTLDDSWGLWGHNIPKRIQMSPNMFAETNGVRSDEQLCFSSPELYLALVAMVKSSQSENPDAGKFMIMPLDNSNACTCSSCLKKGNTPRNASPAVFDLINKLALRFSKLEFFGSAYLSTKSPPDFQLKQNVGVMFTTMDFPKGIALENSAARSALLHQIELWKQKTQNIFIWDYVIHFDNYLTTFPTVLSTALNLQWYQQLGISGVFLHGSEEMYTAFSDLKAFLYAELLMDPQANLESLKVIFFKNFYPNTAHLLQPYYSRCEMNSLNSSQNLDIYGGMKQHIKKYLDAADLFNVLDRLNLDYENCSNEEKENLNPLLSALYFQKLEIYRTQGIRDFGLLEKDTENESWRIKSQVQEDYENWRKYRELTAFEVLNESGLKVSDYENHWEKILLQRSWDNVLYSNVPRFISQPDEDYADASMLTDGAVGFLDYYNNWLISTKNLLHIQIETHEVLSGKYSLEMNFLQDKRHKIYLPKSISIKYNGTQTDIPLISTDRNHNQTIYNFQYELDIRELEILELIINKQEVFQDFATACDEIRLVPIK